MSCNASGGRWTIAYTNKRCWVIISARISLGMGTERGSFDDGVMLFWTVLRAASLWRQYQREVRAEPCRLLEPEQFTWRENTKYAR